MRWRCCGGICFESGFALAGGVVRCVWALAELLPMRFRHFDTVVLRGGLDVCKGLIAFSVGDALYLIEARHGIAHMGGVGHGLFAFLGEGIRGRRQLFAIFAGQLAVFVMWLPRCVHVPLQGAAVFRQLPFWMLRSGKVLRPGKVLRSLATLRAMPFLSFSVPVLVLAYLLGSIPFGYLLVRFVRKEDIRAVGSGNIGATNVARAGSRGLGLLTLLLDAAKGLAAVLWARHLAPGSPGMPSSLAVGAAMAAVLGHVFPVWLRFRGGKGVATALGVFLALIPEVALGAMAVFGLVVATTRLVSLASIVAAVFLPVLALLLEPDRSVVYLAGVSSIALLVIAKHQGNIVRLLNGTEPRFGGKKDISALPQVTGGKRKARA